MIFPSSPLTIYPSILKQERKAGRLLKTFKTSPDEGCDSAPSPFLSPGPYGTGYLEKFALRPLGRNSLHGDIYVFLFYLNP